MKKGIIGFIYAIGGMATGAAVVGKKLSDKAAEVEKLSDKHFRLYNMMNQWVGIKQDGKNLATYFEQRGYKEIAVYGMHYVGFTLLNELKESGIQVSYGIDKNAEKIYEDFYIVKPDWEMEKVDAVVVTAITYFDEIREMLGEKMDCPIISLEEVINQVQKQDTV